MNNKTKDNWLRVIDRIAFFFFIVLVFFMPISGAVLMSSIGGIFLCLILKGILVKPTPEDVREFFSSRINLAVLVFYICIGLSLSASGSLLAKSLNAWIFKWGRCVFLFYSAQVFLKKKHIIFLLRVFVISAFFVCLDGLYQKITGVDFIRGFELLTVQHIGAISASFRHYNDFASFLIVLFFISYGLLIYSKRMFRKSYLLLLLFLILANICLSYSRGAWVAFLVANLFSLVFFTDRKARMLSLSFLLIFVLGIIVIPSLRERFIFMLEKGGDAGRFAMWRASFLMFKESPLVGKGLGLFMDYLPQYANVGYQYAHNCYLQILAETGILGLVSFLWFLREVIVAGLKKMRKQLDSLFLGVFLGLFAYLIHMFFDTQLYSLKLSILFWAIVSFLVVYVKEGSGNEQNISLGKIKMRIVLRKWIKRLGVIVLICLSSFLLCESIFRLFNARRLYLRLTTGVKGEECRLYLFKPNSTFRLKSSKKEEFDASVRINNFGFRGKDMTLKKESGRLRIFVVGDSFTFGVGSEENETIAYLIEEMLASGGRNVEVVNAGKGNTSPLKHYLHLRDIFLNFEPDLVLYLLDFSDLWDDWHDERHLVHDKAGDMSHIDLTFVNGKRDWWRFLVDKSLLIRWVNNKIVRTVRKIQVLGFQGYVKVKLNKQRAKAVIVNLRAANIDSIEYDGYLFMRGRDKEALIKKHWQRTIGYMDMFFDTLRENNIDFILVSYPYGIHVGPRQWNEGRVYWGFEPDRVYTDYLGFDLIEDFARENEISYINALDGFLAAKDQQLFFDLDGHLTPAGNRVLSQDIVKNEVFSKVLDSLTKSDVSLQQ